MEASGRSLGVCTWLIRDLCLVQTPFFRLIASTVYAYKLVPATYELRTVRWKEPPHRGPPFDSSQKSQSIIKEAYFAYSSSLLLPSIGVDPVL